MKIGEVEVATVVPDNLDDRLRASVGVSALEALRILAAGYCMPGLMAKLIEPLVDGEGPSRGELTVMVVEAGANAVRRDLAEIYRSACGVEAPASPPASAPVESEALTVAEYCRRVMAGELEGRAAVEARAPLDGDEIEAEFRRINEEALRLKAEASSDAPGETPRKPAKKKGSSKRGQ